MSSMDEDFLGATRRVMGMLVFEADVAMIVHDMDSEVIFPYKKPVMRKLFKVFQEALFAKGGAGNAR